jgi:hypothetical protein
MNSQDDDDRASTNTMWTARTSFLTQAAREENRTGLKTLRREKERGLPVVSLPSNEGSGHASSSHRLASHATSATVPSKRHHHTEHHHHHQREQERSEDTILVRSGKGKERESTATFNGPLASAEFERMKTEIEALKKVAHDAKKNAKKYSKVLHFLRFIFDTVLIIFLATRGQRRPRRSLRRLMQQMKASRQNSQSSRRSKQRRGMY